MNARLEVFLFDQPAGSLEISGPMRSPEDWTFTYHQDYLNADTPVALSVSLPLRETPHVGAVARNWFANYETYITYFYNKWVVFLLIAALLELYTTHRISHELKKENNQ